jgi:hypothetical protein
MFESNLQRGSCCQKEKLTRPLLRYGQSPIYGGNLANGGIKIPRIQQGEWAPRHMHHGDDHTDKASDRSCRDSTAPG